jgi:hypothetical protein
VQDRLLAGGVTLQDNTGSYAEDLW